MYFLTLNFFLNAELDFTQKNILYNKLCMMKISYHLWLKKNCRFFHNFLLI